MKSLNKKLPPNKKPVGNVEIDWNNSLTNGLRSAILPEIPNDLVTDKALSYGGTTWEIRSDQYGKHWHPTGVNTDVLTTVDTAVTSGTVVGFYKYAGTGSFDNICGWDDNSGSADFNIYQASSNDRLLYKNAVAHNFSAPSDGVMKVAWTFDGTNILDVWQNYNKTTVTYAATPSITHIGIGREHGSFANQEAADANHYYWYLFDRILTDGEILALQKDPYQILKPVKQIPTLLLPPEAKELVWMPKKSHKKKPVGTSEVDRHHPLGKDIQIGVIFGGRFEDVASKQVYTPTGSILNVGGAGEFSQGDNPAVDYIDTGRSVALTEWSVTSRFQLYSVPAVDDVYDGRNIISNDASGWNDDVLFGLSPEGNSIPSSEYKLAVFHQDSTDSLRTTCIGSQASVNTWYTLTATSDGSSLRLYIDGTLVTTTAKAGTALTWGANNIYIGCANLIRGFHGKMDYVYLSGKCWNAGEVASLYEDPYQILKPTKEIKSPLHKATQRKGYKVYK